MRVAIAGSCGSGSKITVHHYSGIVVIDLLRCNRIEVLADPDMPAPQDCSNPILDSNHCISVLKFLWSREVHCLAVHSDKPHDVGFRRHDIVSERAPQNFCGYRGANGLRRVTRNGSIEHIVARLRDNVAVGCFLRRQVDIFHLIESELFVCFI